MEKELILRKGDCVYYPKHRALGVLLRKHTDDSGTVWWTHALRSPPRNDLKNVMVSIQKNKESDFVGSILAGNLEYYPLEKK